MLKPAKNILAPHSMRGVTALCPKIRLRLRRRNDRPGLTTGGMELALF